MGGPTTPAASARIPAVCAIEFDQPTAMTPARERTA